jgi:iron complex outermembrane recepter protein
VVDDEIFVLEPMPGSGVTTNFNADTTLHTGVELGLDTIIALGLIAHGDQLRPSLVYAYNRFRMHDDVSFGDNSLPALPEHIGNFELMYMHPSGFYIGPTVQWRSAFYADFANTLKTKAFVLVGARCGYRDGSGFSMFVEGRNLGDQRYVQSVYVVPDAAGSDQELFRPGTTRAVYAGVEYNVK